MARSPVIVLALSAVLVGGLGGCGDDAALGTAGAPEAAAPPSTDPAAVAPAGAGAGSDPVADPAAGSEATDAEGATMAPGTAGAVETAAATVCERARACCDAFVAAVPSSRRPVEARACSEMDRVLGAAADGADEACEAAIGGWRRSLLLTGIVVPPACLE